MNKYERLNYILPNAFFLLLIAQFDDSILNNIGFDFLVVAVVGLMIYSFNYLGKSSFLFIFILLISSFFVLFQPSGHTFAIVSFFILVLSIMKGKSGKEFIHSDTVIGFVILSFILFNVLGWFIKSVLEVRYLITSVVVFFSFILVFNLARKITWNIKRLKLLYAVICIMMFYTVLTAINNPLNIVPFNTPLLKSYEMEYNEEGSFFIGMIGRPSTAIGLMYGVFILPFLLTSNYKYLNINGRLIFIGFTSSILLCLLGFSKSHTIVLIFGLLLGIVSMIYYFSLKLSYAINSIVAIALLSIFIYLSNSIVNYSFIFKRFEAQPEIFTSMLDNPFTALGTSREDSYRLGLESLGRESWFIGYGYANGGRNRSAWFGSYMLSYKKKDFHNQYYSLPQVFGWGGAISYLLLFLITIFRMRKIILFKLLPIQFRLAALSFLLYFICNLFAEYTMTGLSSPGYIFMLFIMLGLANALYYHFQKFKISKTANERLKIQST